MILRTLCKRVSDIPNLMYVTSVHNNTTYIRTNKQSQYVTSHTTRGYQSRVARPIYLYIKHYRYNKYVIKIIKSLLSP